MVAQSYPTALRARQQGRYAGRVPVYSKDTCKQFTNNSNARTGNASFGGSVQRLAEPCGSSLEFRPMPAVQGCLHCTYQRSGSHSVYGQDARLQTGAGTDQWVSADSPCFKNALSQPACFSAARARLFALLRPSQGGLMWRSAKADVADELALPPQHNELVSLQLNAIERHFYTRQHQVWGRFWCVGLGLRPLAQTAVRSVGGCL